MDKLNDIVRQFGLELSEKQLQQFSRYYDILVEWNSFMNLTAITDRDDVIIKHFADSLLLYKYKDLHDNLSVLDVGTGAGFPGIPLKIAFPELKVTLMDSLNKRLNFLNEVIKELELDNVETVHSSAKKQEVACLFDLKVIPKTMTDGYESWWNVGIATTSEKESVRKACEGVMEGRRESRAY